MTFSRMAVKDSDLSLMCRTGRPISENDSRNCTRTKTIRDLYGDARNRRKRMQAMTDARIMTRYDGKKGRERASWDDVTDSGAITVEQFDNRHRI